MPSESPKPSQKLGQAPGQAPGQALSQQASQTSSQQASQKPIAWLVRVRQWFTQPLTATQRQKWWRSPTVWFWGWVGLAVSLSLSGSVLQLAFSGPHIIQDDARQHVTWMARFVDPGLFPQDEIADYFAAVAPAGYTALYGLAASLGLDPVVFSKLLPLILGAIAAVASYALTLQLLPVPLAGAIATILLQQSLWMRDDLVSGTPVAFAVPGLLLALGAIAAQRPVWTAIALLLLGNFYPQVMLVVAGILVLRGVNGLRSPRPAPSGQDRPDCPPPTATAQALPVPNALTRIAQNPDLRVAIAGLSAAAIVILLHLLDSNPYGPVTTLAQAQQMPTFASGGWSAFFDSDPWVFWMCGKRSGMLPYEWCRLIADHSILLLPVQVWVGWWLPLLGRVARRNPARLPLMAALQPAASVLGQGAIASVGLFFLAHLLLFRLHLPNRYTEHSLRLLLAIGAGIVLTIVLDGILAWATRERSHSPAVAATRFWPKSWGRSLVGWGAIGTLSMVLMFYPTVLRADDFTFPDTGYIVGPVPELYSWLRSHPPNTLTASIAQEVNNLPSFTRRPIRVGGAGYLLPYHQGYYREMEQRWRDLTLAQFSPTWAEIDRYITDSGINFWLVERAGFTADYLDRDDFQQFGLAEPLSDRLSQGQKPVLPSALNDCAAWQDERYVLLDAPCLQYIATQTAPPAPLEWIAATHAEPATFMNLSEISVAPQKIKLH